jgi:hypothetical protein
MVGCRTRQACSARAEKTVEVGRNDKDGTSREVAAPDRKRRGGTCLHEPDRLWEWTLEWYVDEGAVFGEPQERSLNRDSRCEAPHGGEQDGSGKDSTMCDASSKRARRSRRARGSLAHPSEELQVPGSTSKVKSARARASAGRRPRRSSGEGQRPATRILMCEPPRPPRWKRTGHQVLEDPANLMEGRRVSTRPSTSRARLCRGSTPTLRCQKSRNRSG